MSASPVLPPLPSPVSSRAQTPRRRDSPARKTWRSTFQSVVFVNRVNGSRKSRVAKRGSAADQHWLMLFRMIKAKGKMQAILNRRLQEISAPYCRPTQRDGGYDWSPDLPRRPNSSSTWSLRNFLDLANNGNSAFAGSQRSAAMAKPPDDVCSSKINKTRFEKNSRHRHKPTYFGSISKNELSPRSAWLPKSYRVDANNNVRPPKPSSRKVAPIVEPNSKIFYLGAPCCFDVPAVDSVNLSKQRPSTAISCSQVSLSSSDADSEAAWPGGRRSCADGAKARFSSAAATLAMVLALSALATILLLVGLF